MGIYRLRRARERLYRCTGGRCWYCDREVDADAATVDHLKPKAQGGSNRIANLVLACQGCNTARDRFKRKGADPVAFRLYVRALAPGNLWPVDRNRVAANKAIMKAAFRNNRGARGFWHHGDGVDLPVDLGA